MDFGWNSTRHSIDFRCQSDSSPSFCGNGDNSGCFKAAWNMACLQRDVKDGCKHWRQLISTVFQGGWRDRLRTGCFAGVLSFEDSTYYTCLSRMVRVVVVIGEEIFYTNYLNMNKLLNAQPGRRTFWITVTPQLAVPHISSLTYRPSCCSGTL